MQVLTEQVHKIIVGLSPCVDQFCQNGGCGVKYASDAVTNTQSVIADDWWLIKTDFAGSKPGWDGFKRFIWHRSSECGAGLESAGRGGVAGEAQRAEGLTWGEELENAEECGGCPAPLLTEGKVETRGNRLREIQGWWRLEASENGGWGAPVIREATPSLCRAALKTQQYRKDKSSHTKNTQW